MDVDGLQGVIEVLVQIGHFLHQIGQGAAPFKVSQGGVPQDSDQRGHISPFLRGDGAVSFGKSLGHAFADGGDGHLFLAGKKVVHGAFVDSGDTQDICQRGPLVSFRIDLFIGRVNQSFPGFFLIHGYL